MKILLAVVAVASLAATVATAQDLPNDRQTIVVVGEGVAERVPDIFSISISVEGRGSDQVTAMRNLAEVQSHISQELGKLRGLTHGEITTGELNVQPTYSGECLNRRHETTSDCHPTGYVATNDMNLTAAPVDRAGDALSLASELGALTARFEGGELSDAAPLLVEAREAAYADAVRQAEALAAASGQRIVRTLRIISDDYSPPRLMESGVETIVVTGSRIPSVLINSAPPPIRETVRLSVIFETE